MGGEVSPSAAEIDAFAMALAGAGERSAIGALIGRGADGWLRRKVFAPVARRLGEWWVEDRICFATVTLGMAELQRLAWMHGRAPAHPTPLHPPMLLTTLPGEQHTFGLLMLIEELRARGVEPAFLPSPTVPQLIASAASGLYLTMGFSLGSQERLGDIEPLARALRAASPRPLRLLVGGAMAHVVEPGAAGVDEVIIGESALDRLCTMAVSFAQDHAAAA